MNEIGRNNACPCGSGKKYKKCCLDSDIEKTAQSNPSSEASQKLKNALAGQQFESLGDMQVFIDYKTQKHNETPQVELGGFSPSQLQILLYKPIEEQDFIQWNKNITSNEVKKSPVLVIFYSVKTYLTSNKAKVTAKGNLPVALVKNVLSDYQLTFNQDIEELYCRRINKEEDFRELAIARIIFERAGLLRKYKGCFVLTKKSLKLSDSEVFKLLFSTYIHEYNWAYEDGYPEIDFFQTATYYSLVKLNHLNGNSIHTIEFAENFLRTFPIVLNEFEDNYHKSKVHTATNAYTLRMIDRFWQFFGLIRLEGDMFTKDYKQTIIATPLLQKIFTFPRNT